MDVKTMIRFIGPKDVLRILPVSERHARRLLQQARDHWGKAGHQEVTVFEFCLFKGIDEAIAEALLG